MPENTATQILIVDDEELVRGTLVRILEPRGYQCITAADAAEARSRLKSEQPELILCDVRMPGESGVELARALTSEYPHIGIVMVSAADDLETADELFSLGVYGYVVKPFTATDVLMQVAMAHRRRELEMENRDYVRTLVSIAFQRTSLLLQTFRGIGGGPNWEETVDERALHKMAQALEFRDRDIGHHTERVSAYARLLAERAGLDAGRCEEIRLAAILHDVGKVAIPDRILFKPAGLSEGELETIRRHPEVGFHLLAGWPGHLFETASLIAWTHHEWWDGTGYPRRLAKDEIPVEGRITAIGDAFDALTTDRPYRGAMNVDQAVETICGEEGHFDPDLVMVFVEGKSQLEEIRGGLS
jgi:putative two-component system response regulator